MLAEPYHFKAAGLPNMYLLNGIMIISYGRMVHIESLSGLHHAIGLHIIEKLGKMTGNELRFIRKQMKKTQADLANDFKVSAQTVANWEKGGVQDFGPAEAYVRLAYVLHLLPNDARAAVLKGIAGLPSANNHQPRRKLTDLQRRKIVNGLDEPSLAA